MEVKVGENFRVGRKIGAGSFGEIYLGINIQTEEEVAIKLEPIKTKFPQLVWESKIIQYLQGGVGIPRLYWFGKDGDFQVMIIELLGHSLEDLFEMCQRKLSIKTVLMLAEQIISRIEYVHAKNFVYRDIKPDNFLIGTGKKADHIYLIDYGLSKRFRDPKTGQHIEYRDGKAFVGTFRYASINSHNGIESSRRDDMEAIGYMLMYFLRGSLPWQGIKATSKKEKYDLIAQAKQNTPVEELCKGFPDEFAGYITYTRNLKFEEKPDYNWLKAQFRNLLYRMDYTIDFIFDWSKMNSNNMGKLKESGIIEKVKEDSHDPVNKESPFKTMPDSTFSRKRSLPSLKGEKTPMKLGGNTNLAAKSPTQGIKPNGSITKNVMSPKPAGISQFNSACKKEPLATKEQLPKEKPSIVTGSGGSGNFIKVIKSIRKESDELQKNGPLHRSSPNTPSNI